MSQFDAVDSTLGFGHQILSALILLLEAEDDESVSIEVVDDVSVSHSSSPSGPLQTRYQVSHTLGIDPTPLGPKSVKLWKTLRIWAEEFSRKDRYVLLTCAPVMPELSCLLEGQDRARLHVLLEAEAMTTIAEVEAGEAKHSDRIKGCRAFLKLTKSDRSALLQHLSIFESAPNILEIDKQLASYFRNTIKPEHRQAVVDRVREFWLNRGFKAISKELNHVITRGELISYVEQLAASFIETSLPDDFGSITPPDGTEVPNVMRKQIEIVNGGKNRINRAKVAHWQSRNQRNRWLSDNIAFRSELDQFDKQLLKEWGDRHGPLCDDLLDASEADKKTKGCSLLDWSHLDAPANLIKVGSRTAPSFLVQGTFQDLADAVRLGWHPDYEALLAEDGNAPNKL